MAVSDLDGTLTRTDRTLNRLDRETFAALGEKGTVRVIATGRTVYSTRQVVPADYPIDYLIFSSGAGIMNWRTSEILRTHHLVAEQIVAVETLLRSWGLDYMLHDPIPETHRFRYRASGRENADFRHRCEKHAALCSEWNPDHAPECATQFVVVEPPESGEALHARLLRELSAFSVIRATSPLDGKSTWVEIFPRSVAKSLACAWVAEREGVLAAGVLAVGNDYNDLDLLRWAKTRFVVANAPEPLRNEFPVVPSSDENGFAVAVRLAKLLSPS